jgi:hypothetical protein
MRDRNWSVPALIFIYASVFGVLALVVGYGFTKVTMASEEAARRSEQEKTLLNERIESAREIKRALARPVPPPEPLPPITAKLANPTKVANPEEPKIAASAKHSKEKPHKLQIPAAAWNAMAMGTGADAAPRHVSPTVDRAGLNGW